MGRKERGQMLTKGSRAAGRSFQVTDGRIRTKLDLAASGPPTVREFTFEMVGDANEIFVEAAKFKGVTPSQREVATHETLDLPTLRGGELLSGQRSIPHIVIPRLQDTACYQPVPIAMRRHVRRQQIGERHDIVIQEQHDVVAGLDQALIHCARNRRFGKPKPPDVPACAPLLKRGIDLPRMLACLVKHQNLGGSRLKS